MAHSRQDDYDVKSWYEPATPTVDICFVHGLGGHRDRTWTAAKAGEPWPAALLPDEFPQARLLTFGYDAAVVRLGPVAQSSIESLAKSLLYSLRDNRQKACAQQRPLVFVVHSLGGIVCKKAVALSRRGADSTLDSLAESLVGIVFMGTPHDGSSFADAARRLAPIVTFFGSWNQNLLDVLKKDNQIATDIDKEFWDAWTAIRKTREEIQIFCFFEVQPPRGVKKCVVPERSAVYLQHPHQQINGDHHTIVKYKSIEDPGFKRLCGVLHDFLAPQRRVMGSAVVVVGGGREGGGGGSAPGRPVPGSDVDNTGGPISQSSQTGATRQGTFNNGIVNQNSGTIIHNNFHSVSGGTINMGQSSDSSEDKSCLQDLRITDPDDDRTRIQNTKGGLLKDVYLWVFDNADFRRWQHDTDSRLLWVRGDPGKGKTMLMCGIIEQLMSSTALSYFFCEANNQKLNRATNVLRGLIYRLVQMQPAVISYVREKYDVAGKQLFEDGNAWEALSKIFVDMTNDERLSDAILLVDALDECVIDRPKLLALIARPSRVKWIVSSRNWPEIVEHLTDADQQVQLRLELNDSSISDAVDTYIRHKVDHLASKKRYTKEIREAVQQHLTANADGTFLWVALVCRALAEVPKRLACEEVKAFPQDLDGIYGHMIRIIQTSKNQRDAKNCWPILAIASTVFRPITLDELPVLCPQLEDFDKQDLEEAIDLCGSFLTLRSDVLYFIHQSAKEYLVGPAKNTIFPSGIPTQHHDIFSHSLTALLSDTLHRDMYGINDPGPVIDCVVRPEHDPLASIGYSCLFWIEHLENSEESKREKSLQDNSMVHHFFQEKYLYWLEALSLLRSMSTGTISVKRLNSMVHEMGHELASLVRDALRFFLSHKFSIENAPLQTYVSALLFSPTNSKVRKCFRKEEPDWIITKPVVQTEWDSCIQTLEGHRESVLSVVFSPNGKQLASGSNDKTVKVWDMGSGDCIQTLEGHNSPVTSLVFSPNGKYLASGSRDKTVKVWDVASGDCAQTLKHDDGVSAVSFSTNGKYLASGSGEAAKVWDVASGDCTQTLIHDSSVTSVVFSPSRKHLASGYDDTVKVWDVASGDCVQTLMHSSLVKSVVFAPDGKHLASGLFNKTVKIWEVAPGDCIQTLKPDDRVISVNFSPDGKYLASALDNRTVMVWDVASGDCTQTLKHDSWVASAVFSPDGKYLASGSGDNAVKVWDIALGAHTQTLERHAKYTIATILFSPNGKYVMSATGFHTFGVWDVASGHCIQTLNCHDDWVKAAAFSPDGRHIAAGLKSNTVKVWDVASGECTKTFEGYNKSFASMVYSPDGKQLASGSGNTVTFWDVTSGDCTQTLESHSNWYTSVIFSPDGRQLYEKSGRSRYGLSEDRCWITMDGQKRVWLPIEYRPGDFATCGQSIGVCSEAARLIILTFDQT